MTDRERDWPPEPWLVYRPSLRPGVAQLRDATNRFIKIHSPWVEDAFEHDPAEATAVIERAAACVNACAGLDPAGVPGLVEAVDAEVTRLRGAARLGGVVSWESLCEMVADRLAAALAKVKGGGA